MTNADYYRAYKLARSKSAVISLKAQVEIRSLYLKASKQTAEKLRDALNPGKRELTESEWNALRYELTEPGKTITDGIIDVAMGAVGAGAGLYIIINADYLKAAMPNDVAITKEGIDKLAKVQTRKAAEAISTRTYGTGKAFSTRVWDAKADYENTIRKIVEEGIRIGRDPAKIAKDIQAYTADGRLGIAKRWASLERGDAAWTQRLPKNIDWRAVRLVRSELQATIQDAGKLAGQTNPGATGEYEWLLGPGLNHCSTCIEYSTMTFTKDTLPDYPHSNCLVRGTYVQTEKGNEKIEYLLPGDYIVSHNGAINPITKTWKNRYSGNVIEISTESGIITMTPDHPVISNGRWVSAKSLKLGDNILRVSTNVPSNIRTKTKPNNLPSISNKQGSFLNIKFLLSSEGVPITAVNFNGKLYVFIRKIDVILKESKIGKWLFTRYFEGIVHKFFIDGKAFALSLNGPLAKFLVGTLDSSDCIMTCGRTGLSSVVIKPFISFGNGKLGISKKRKMPVYNVSGNPEPFSYLINREILIPEQVVNASLGNVDSVTHVERIISIKHLHVNEDVYNITVAGTSSYIANGFASHNCGCVPQAILRDRETFVNDLKEWTQGDASEKTRYISDWYQTVYAPAQGR